MSEAINEVVEQDPVQEFLLRENVTLKQQVVDLQAKVAASDFYVKKPKPAVREAIIELITEVQGVSEVEELDTEVIAALNETLESLELETVVKTFTVRVTVLLTHEVEIEVEAGSVEEATEKIENGDYETEILDEVDGRSLDIYEYQNVEEA